ncbi:MAG TPA: ATP-binding protein [Patescibacteria group bacterium]|nr:ATP-binding protein [Patescibacteria group bacterium]
MISPITLKENIVEQRKNFLHKEQLIHREMIDRLEFRKILSLHEPLIITGIRRCGKSFFLKLIWQHIQKQQNISDQNILYINFEDEKLLHFSAEDFDVLLENFFELYTVNHKQRIYLLFDEIQIIQGWEKFIVRLMREKKYKIIITGSNATLLSKEIASTLTGRNIQVQLFPLTFREFARYKLHELPNKKDLFDTEIRIRIKKLFHQYLLNGGFPAVVSEQYRPLLQEYLRGIIYRDIVLRHRIKHEASLREIVSFVLSNIGVPLSLQNMSNMTRIKNIATVKNYLTYLQDTFLLYGVAKHSFSVKEQVYNPDKFYVADSGMYHEVAIVHGKNSGRVLENIVFLELLTRNQLCYYFKKKHECDFIIQKNKKPYEAIQVTQTLSIINREREIQGIIEALNTLKLKNGRILTEDEHNELHVEGKKIIVEPIWQWCLYQ